MKNVMDIAKTTTCIEKSMVHKEQEELQFSSIRDIVSRLNYYYKTSNTNKLIDKENEILNKFKIISKIHENDIYVINKNIEKYQKTSKTIEKKFDDIV